MLDRVDEGADLTYPMKKPRNDVPDTLDAQIVADASRSSKTVRRCSLATRFRTRTGQSARACRLTSFAGLG